MTRGSLGKKFGSGRGTTAIRSRQHSVLGAWRKWSTASAPNARDNCGPSDQQQSRRFGHGGARRVFDEEQLAGAAEAAVKVRDRRKSAAVVVERQRRRPADAADRVDRLGLPDAAVVPGQLEIAVRAVVIRDGRVAVGRIECQGWVQPDVARRIQGGQVPGVAVPGGVAEVGVRDVLIGDGRKTGIRINRNRGIPSCRCPCCPRSWSPSRCPAPGPRNAGRRSCCQSARSSDDSRDRTPATRTSPR